MASTTEAATPVVRRTVLTIVVIAIAMAALFVGSYTVAMDRPAPRRIPTALTGEADRDPVLTARLDSQMRGALEYQRYPSAGAARRAIEGQRVYAALVLGPGRPRLLVAGAAGNSLAQQFRNAALAVDQAGRERLTVVDVKPLPDSDRMGLAAFYVMIAATLLGFVTTLQLRGNAPRLRLRAWLGAIGLLSVGGGLVLAVTTGPLIGALPAPVPVLWVTLTAQIAIAALFGTLMEILIGRWAVVPTWLMFVAVGNAASGGAVATPLLPQPYAAVSAFHPNGGTVAVLHNAVYFPEASGQQPVLVLGGWIAGLLALVLLAGRFLHRAPGGARSEAADDPPVA